MALPIYLTIILRFSKTVEDRNIVTDHHINRNDVSGNTNLKHPNVLKGIDLNESFKVQSNSKSHKQSDTLSLNLMSKGLNFDHLNVQGISGKDMSKFSEIKAKLTSPENSSFIFFCISGTKPKPDNLSTCFNIDGFQAPFRKNNDSKGSGGIIVYVRKGIGAKRRVDLETNSIACIWLEITVGKNKPFLIGNMYRPPASKNEFSDRFENFIDYVPNEGKEIILLGNILNDHEDAEWETFTTSLGSNR